MFSYVFNNTVYHLLHVVANNRKWHHNLRQHENLLNDIRRLEGQNLTGYQSVLEGYAEDNQGRPQCCHHIMMTIIYPHDSIILCYQVLRNSKVYKIISVGQACFIGIKR